MNDDGGLYERDLAADPVDQFGRWFDSASAAGVPEPEAMCVATVLNGIPSARMVLLKSFDRDGFVFRRVGSSRPIRSPHCSGAGTP